MIDAYTASISATVLMIAGFLEFIKTDTYDKDFHLASNLAAFGFFMLAARFYYLISTDDLARLNIFGTASIDAIALSRIIACARCIRKNL